MMAMPISRRARPDRDDHLRPVRPDHADDIAGERFAVPVSEGLFGVLRIAEIVRPGEELLGAIHASRGEQLLCTDRAERLAQFVADLILPAVAAREGEIGAVHLSTSREPGEQRGILIVGVCPHHEHATGDGEAAHELVQRDRAAFLPGGGTRRDAQQERGGEGRQDAPSACPGHSPVPDQVERATGVRRRDPVVRTCTCSASDTIRDCSAVCVSVYPSAGLARSLRP